MELALNLANVAVFVLICVGVVLHRRRRLHVRLMLLSFGFDLALLVTVEILRHAVDQAMDVFSAGGLWALRIHILFSLAAGVMWLLMIYSGTRVLRGREEARGRHSRWARFFLLARFGNMVTAFFV